MTFVSKGASIFKSQDKTFPDCTPPKLQRSDGRLKKYDSIVDDRVWSNEEKDRYQYLYDMMNGSQTCLIPSSCFKYIPLEELIKLLLAERDAYIKDLEQRLGILEGAGPSNRKPPGRSKTDKPLEELYKNGTFVDPEDQDVLAMKDKIAKLKAELEECKTARDTLREAMHKLENIDEIVNENKSLKEKLICSNEMIKSLKENQNKLEKELENLRTKSQIQMDLDEAQEMLRNGDQLAERNRLQKRVEELQLELGQAKKKQEEIEMLKKQSESASLSLEEMARENQCYKKKLASMKDLEKQIEELKEKANEMVDKYKKDSMKANDQDKQLKDLSQELKMLREERDRLRRRVNELACYEQQYNSLQCKLKQVDGILEENAKLNCKLASLNKLELENELLKCQLQQCQVSGIQAEESREKIAELENAVADQEEEMKDLLCQIERLTRTYGDGSELERLKQELCKKEFKLKLCEEQLSEIPLLEAEIDELRWKLENCYQNITGNPPQSEIRKFSQKKARLLCSKYEKYEEPQENEEVRERRQVDCSDIQNEMTQFLEKTDKEKMMSLAEIQELLQTSKGIISCLAEDMNDRQKEMEELANCNREMSEEIATLKEMIGNPDVANLIKEISELKKLLCEKQKKISCLEKKVCCLEDKIAKSGDLCNVNKNIECLEAEIEYLKYLNKQMRADLREACREIERCAELEGLRDDEEKPARRPGESRTKSQKDEYNLETKGSSNDSSDQDELEEKGPAKKKKGQERPPGQKDEDNISEESDFSKKLENLDDVDALKDELKRLKDQNRQLKDLIKYYEERLNLEKTSKDPKSGRFKDRASQTGDALEEDQKSEEEDYGKDSDYEESGPVAKEQEPDKEASPKKDRSEDDALPKSKRPTPQTESEYEDGTSETDSQQKPKEREPGKQLSPKKDRSEDDALPKSKRPTPQTESEYEDETSETDSQQKPKEREPGKQLSPKKDRSEDDALPKAKRPTPQTESEYEDGTSETDSQQKPKEREPGKQLSPRKDRSEDDALPKAKRPTPQTESEYEDETSETDSQQKPKEREPGKQLSPKKDRSEDDALPKAKGPTPQTESEYEDGTSETDSQQKPKEREPGKQLSPKKGRSEDEALPKSKRPTPQTESEYEDETSETDSQQKPKEQEPSKQPSPRKDRSDVDALQKPRVQGPGKDPDYEKDKKAIEDAIQNVEDEVDGLSVKLEENQKLLKKQGDMEKELDKLRNELKACKEREGRGRGKGQEETLLEEMVGLREQAEQAKLENKKLKDELGQLRKLLEECKKSQSNEEAQASLMSSKREGMSYPFQPAAKAVPQTVIPIREKQRASVLERGKQQPMEKPGKAAVIRPTPNESVKVVIDGRPEQLAAAQPKMRDREPEGSSFSDESIISFSDIDPDFRNFLCSLNPCDHKTNICQIEKRYRETVAALQEKNDKKLKNLINQHKKESAMRDKNFNESLTSMRTGYESDIRKLAERHKGSILRLQNLHEDEVRELNENYERQLNAVQSQNDSVVNDLTTGVANKFKSLAEQHNRELEELETKYQKLLQKKEREYASLVSGVDATGSSHDKELKRLKTSNQKKISLIEQKYEKLLLCERKKYERQLEETIKKLKEGKGVSHGVCQCRFPERECRDPNAPPEFNEILQKILTLGLGSLSFNEVALVHKQTCTATNDFVLNPEARPLLLPGTIKGNDLDQSVKGNREKLLDRIYALENEISVKQKETQDAILHMESVVKAESKRLQELKDSLRSEWEKNSSVKSQMARPPLPTTHTPPLQMDSGRSCSGGYEAAPRPNSVGQVYSMPPVSITDIVPESHLLRQPQIDVQCIMDKMREFEKQKCICPQVAPEKDTTKTKRTTTSGVRSEKGSQPGQKAAKAPKKSGKK